MTIVRKVITTWGAFLAVLATGVVLAGCHTQQESPFAEIPGISAPAVTGSAAAGPAIDSSAPATVAPGNNPATAYSDVLRPRDTIRIEYNDLPVVIPPFVGPIKEDGTITLILNKKFMAAGKSPGELEKEIRATYVPDFYKSMTVTVSPVNETRYYYVGGEVRAPGRQMYLGRITVLKAIQSAGDFTDFARKSKVKLTRADGKRVETIDCPKALQNPRLDVEVYPGDTIHVPRRIW